MPGAQPHRAFGVCSGPGSLRLTFQTGLEKTAWGECRVWGGSKCFLGLGFEAAHCLLKSMCKHMKPWRHKDGWELQAQVFSSYAMF